MCDHHAVSGPDRRTLLAAGAGVASYAALQVAAPAAAGSSRTLRFSGRFTGVAQADWHYLPFRVPRGVRAIEVSYAYEALETGAGFTANVIDLGLFDPHGFRGWSGGARSRARVSASSATPGYLAGPIAPGRWRVALGPFLVVPPGVAWKATVTLRFGPPGPAFTPAPPPRSVRGSAPGWYRGDLHTHTVHSDGRHTQPALARLAREAGLDFLGSSEHNTSSAGLSWGRHVRPGDPLLVVVGEEVTTRDGHWLAMGLPAGTWVDWRFRPADDRLARATRRVRGLGGLAIACHPFVPIPGTRWGFGNDYADMDAVELWNGPWTLDDQVALEAWHALLVAGRFVPAVGTSDSHHEGQEVGRAQTVVRLPLLSSAAVVRAVRSGHAWLAESSEVDLTFTASLGDRSATCGERLTASATDLVDVRLEVRGAPACLAQIHGPTGPVAGALTTGTDGRAAVTARVPAAVTPFVRAEVRRLDAAPVANPLEGVPALPMVAMTNPVFLGPVSPG
ncbi:CehA/McbA family metallohydrolase [Nocardioides sp.]|uniref:CehA/McbA family metallohydrolase n=1 Tax=Nocardioides sp. TaxID=35761 RepID=UPI00286D60F2|nr:CehA/McbA family metallohydrolase [Nocardioides sp.]